jgi:hypothetical protein
MAIQIENWKENLKENQLERKLLLEIKTSLEQDLAFLNETIQPRASEVIKASGSLLDQIYYQFDYHDSIQQNANKLEWGIEFEPRTSAFENLKSMGINLISNDDLRLSIVELYDFEYQRTLRIIDIIVNSYRREQVIPYITAHLEYHLGLEVNNEIITSLVIPEEALNTPEFINILSTINGKFKDTFGRLNKLESKIRQLITDIESELNNTT